MIPVLPAGAAAPASGPSPTTGGLQRSFTAALERASSGVARPPRLVEAPVLVGAAGGGIPVPGGAHLLEAVDRARVRLDQVLAAARSGRTFSAQELLGLQAEAYRTVQTVDLGVKLVEQGAQSIRQALATQV